MQASFRAVCSLIRAGTLARSQARIVTPGWRIEERLGRARFVAKCLVRKVKRS